MGPPAWIVATAPSSAQASPTRHRRRRRLLRAGLGATLLGTAAVLALYRDPAPRILERRGELAAVREELLAAEGASIDREVRLASSSGLEIDLNLRLPAGDGPPLPAVLILGGHRTGRKAAQLVPPTPKAVVAAM